LAIVEKRRKKYFQVLDSGECAPEWVSFQFKQYDEALYELLCAAEAEHQVDPKQTADGSKSAAARNSEGAAALQTIYQTLQANLRQSKSIYDTQGKYKPPQLTVSEGKARRPQKNAVL